MKVYYKFQVNHLPMSSRDTLCHNSWLKPRSVFFSIVEYQISRNLLSRALTKSRLQTSKTHYLNLFIIESTSSEVSIQWYSRFAPARLTIPFCSFFADTQETGQNYVWSSCLFGTASSSFLLCTSHAPSLCSYHGLPSCSMLITTLPGPTSVWLHCSLLSPCKRPLMLHYLGYDFQYLIIIQSL